MMPVIDYQAIVQELKRRFSAIDVQDPDVRKVQAQMCVRMIRFMEIDPMLSPEEVILRLEDKWRSEGLIQSND